MFNEAPKIPEPPVENLEFVIPTTRDTAKVYKDEIVFDVEGVSVHNQQISYHEKALIDGVEVFFENQEFPRVIIKTEKGEFELVIPSYISTHIPKVTVAKGSGDMYSVTLSKYAYKKKDGTHSKSGGYTTYEVTVTDLGATGLEPFFSSDDI